MVVFVTKVTSVHCSLLLLKHSCSVSCCGHLLNMAVQGKGPTHQHTDQMYDDDDDDDDDNKNLIK